MRPHAGADERDLADLVVVEQRFEADLALESVQRRHRGLAVGVRQRERDVGEVRGGGRHVLHDHVEVDLRFRERVEDRRRLADLVRDPDDRDLGLAAVVGDPGDDRCFHADLTLNSVRVVDAPRDNCALEGAERRPDVDRDVVAPGVLDRAQVEHLGAASSELQHLLVGDRVELARVRDDPRVGGEDAVDVGVDLADVGLERGRQRDRGGVGAAAAEGGDLLGLLADALEAGHDHDVALVDRAADPTGRDVEDLGLAVDVVGDHAGLRAGERPGREAEVGDRHRNQRHRDPLARGQQHVELTRRRQRAHLGGEIEQLVGAVAHGGDRDDDVVAGLLGVGDATGHALDGVGVGQRRAAVLLHDNAHFGCAPGSTGKVPADSTERQAVTSPPSKAASAASITSSSESLSTSSRSWATTDSSAFIPAPARAPHDDT